MRPLKAVAGTRYVALYDDGYEAIIDFADDDAAALAYSKRRGGLVSVEQVYAEGPRPQSRFQARERATRTVYEREPL